jgi:nucleotide-binding universal stress UspA family protein
LGNPDEKEATMQKVLVTLDGSNLSEEILPIIAHGFDPANTEVILLRVGEPADAIMTAGSRDMHPLGIVGSTAPAMIAALTGRDWGEAKGQGLDRARERIGSYLAKHSQTLVKQGFHVECIAEFGDPAVVVVDCARQRQVDLIAMCTHGRTGLAAALIGSVASAVLRGSSVPVLLKRPVQPA